MNLIFSGENIDKSLTFREEFDYCIRKNGTELEIH